MKKAITDRDLDQFPVVRRANSRLHRIFFLLMGLGLILPFFLPESAWLLDSRLIQGLSKLVPSARKLAGVAQTPSLVEVFIIVMLTLSLILGIVHFLLLNTHRSFLDADIALSAPRGRWFLWIKAAGGIVFWTALIAFFYIFPAEINSTSGGSRGQLILSLMVMTKPGLAIFGGFISAGLAAVWFYLLYAMYSFFQLPFLGTKKTGEQQK